MHSTTFLLECLLRAGIRDVVAVEPATGGVAALAGVATRRDAPSVFVKAFAEALRDGQIAMLRDYFTELPPVAPDGNLR